MCPLDYQLPWLHPGGRVRAAASGAAPSRRCLGRTGLGQLDPESNDAAQDQPAFACDGLGPALLAKPLRKPHRLGAQGSRGSGKRETGETRSCGDLFPTGRLHDLHEEITELRRRYSRGMTQFRNFNPDGVNFRLQDSNPVDAPTRRFTHGYPSRAHSRWAYGGLGLAIPTPFERHGSKH